MSRNSKRKVETQRALEEPLLTTTLPRIPLLLPLLCLFFLVIWMLDGQTPNIKVVTNRGDNVMLCHKISKLWGKVAQEYLQRSYHRRQYLGPSA